MTLTSKHPLLYIFKVVSFSFKSLIYALILSAVLKLLFNDGGWVNYAVLSVIFIILLFVGKFVFRIFNQKSMNQH